MNRKVETWQRIRRKLQCKKQMKSAGHNKPFIVGKTAACMRSTVHISPVFVALNVTDANCNALVFWRSAKWDRRYCTAVGQPGSRAM